MGPSGESAHDRPDQHAKEDLARQAREAERAIWGGEDEAPQAEQAARDRRFNVGAVSGDLGPKNRIAGDLRDLSLRGRASADRVPFGTSTGKGGGPLLVALLLIVLVAVGLLAILWWLVS